jgi:hypothetical protein
MFLAPNAVYLLFWCVSQVQCMPHMMHMASLQTRLWQGPWHDATGATASPFGIQLTTALAVCPVRCTFVQNTLQSNFRGCVGLVVCQHHNLHCICAVASQHILWCCWQRSCSPTRATACYTFGCNLLYSCTDRTGYSSVRALVYDQPRNARGCPTVCVCALTYWLHDVCVSCVFCVRVSRMTAGAGLQALLVVQG